MNDDGNEDADEKALDEEGLQDNVRVLRAVPQVKAESSQVVTLLERFLALAREGKMVGVAVAGATSDGGMIQGFVAEKGAHATSVIVGLDLVKLRMLEAIK